jgi:hypothetical protein
LIFAVVVCNAVAASCVAARRPRASLAAMTTGEPILRIALRWPWSLLFAPDLHIFLARRKAFARHNFRQSARPA